MILYRMWYFQAVLLSLAVNLLMKTVQAVKAETEKAVHLQAL